MKPKTIKIIYWVLTGLFAMAMLFSGVSELMQNEQAVEVMKHLVDSLISFDLIEKEDGPNA